MKNRSGVLYAQSPIERPLLHIEIMSQIFANLMQTFRHFSQNLIQRRFVVRAEDEEEEEETVDPQEVLREECTTDHCKKYKEKLDECNARVNSRKNTAETCMEEVIDFMHCLDHCAAKSLFSKLK
ncbi:cytochrome b-c1 complex subunit 6-like protein [Dinothrombium tinctorium]|uniref:Cytochrome b-c1 complex subunit 6-like protein n=1 Tax=Dinothrombium tinctorium TaxID=1965070 RepID=A0A443R753_9ACAR|nr:cytochrome b-c1 complex subunit 6-like protein [Dinothrombium tinctorium]